jgi:hypothetical protein
MKSTGLSDNLLFLLSQFALKNTTQWFNEEYWLTSELEFESKSRPLPMDGVRYANTSREHYCRENGIEILGFKDLVDNLARTVCEEVVIVDMLDKAKKLVKFFIDPEEKQVFGAIKFPKPKNARFIRPKIS